VAGIGEAEHVPDFGDEYRTEDRADAGQLLNRPIAAIAVKFGGDLLGEPPLVGVENVDQLQQRGHPLRVGGAERHPGQALAALHAEQVGHRDQHTGLGEHGMRLGFESGSDRDELRAVAHQFAQLASCWWGDPRLG